MSKQGVAKTQEYRKSRERAEDSVESAVDLTGLVEKRNKKGTLYYKNHDGEIIVKECRGECRKVKKLKDFYMKVDALGGVASECKVCFKKRCKKYHSDKSCDVEWVERRRERAYKLNQERRQGEEWREKERVRVRVWREENKRKVSEYAASYYERNRRKIRERNINFRKENKEKIKEYDRVYRKENKNKYRILAQQRRARKYMLPDDLTDAQQNEILDNFDGKCALTGAEWTWDHAIPLAVGHGGTTFGNMYPLRADLNSSKGDRCIFDWFPANRERFNLPQEKFDELIEYLADLNGMTTQEYEEYVRWCHANPRTLEDLQASNTNPDAS